MTEGKYKVHNIYTFKVKGLFQNPNTEKWWINLEDEDCKSARVQAYDYQSEWKELPETMKCFVEGIDEHSNWLYLRQYWPDVLNEKYTVGQRYQFIVREEKTDNATGSTFFQIEDILCGLTHRYYANDGEKYEIGDTITLRVAGIVASGGNSAHLELKPKRPRIAVDGNPCTEPDISDVLDSERICDDTSETNEENELLKTGQFGRETNVREFKSSIVYPAGKTTPNIDEQIDVIAKVIASFQNSDGGNLFIGINDRGDVCGINNDFPYLNSSEEDSYNYQLNVDGYENKIRCAVRNKLGTRSNNSLHFRFFKTVDDLVYCVIEIKAETRPVYMKGFKLYQRAGNMIQTIKGEDITNFILARMANGQNKSITQSTAIEESSAIMPQNTTIPIQNPSAEISGDQKMDNIEVPQLPVSLNDHTNDKTWIHINIYNNGEWSYTKNLSKAQDIFKSVIVYASQKSDDLLLCYSSGNVNRVKIQDLTKKTEGKRYKNGQNADLTLIDIMVCGKHDLIVLKSEVAGKEWIKIHHTTAITCHQHGALQLAGNLMIKRDTALLKAAIIPFGYEHFVTDLILQDYQTSQYQGFEIRHDSQLKNSINIVHELCNL